MIETKHLIASIENCSPDGSSVMFKEYMAEIIVRLKKYDELKEIVKVLVLNQKR